MVELAATIVILIGGIYLLDMIVEVLAAIFDW